MTVLVGFRADFLGKRGTLLQALVCVCGVIQVGFLAFFLYFFPRRMVRFVTHFV